MNDTIRGGYMNDRNVEIAGILKELSEKYGVSPINISVAILLCQPFQALPVTAVSSVAQLEETLKADSVELEAEDIARLNSYFG
jgi:aryl-alcohol dehydrogenase-like predicted oxidoreductase